MLVSIKDKVKPNNKVEYLQETGFMPSVIDVLGGFRRISESYIMRLIQNVAKVTEYLLVYKLLTLSVSFII